MSIRQRFRRLLFGETVPNPVQRAIWQATTGEYGLCAVSRAEALTVDGVMRARDAICSIATLPLVTYKADWSTVDNRLFRQIDPSRINVVTLSRTLEDLFFEGLSWWHVLEREDGDPDARPVYCEHVELGRVSETEEHGTVVRRLDGKRVRTEDLILFESPKPGLLKYGGRLLRRAINLQKTAALYADNPRPLDYFTPLEGADALEEEEAEEMIRRWREARKVNGTAYIKGLEYHEVSTPTPQELQLIDGLRQAEIEIANFTGLDAEDLGVAVSDHTYFNAQDRDRQRINRTLALFMRAIADRLSMGDITARGHRVEFDLDDYLKADPATRAQVQLAYQAAGVITRDEIRKEERLPPLSTEQLLQIDGQRRIQATVQPRQIGAGDGAS